MIWGHFRTIVWLRARLFWNRTRRAGKTSTVVAAILLVLFSVSSVSLFLAAWGLGVRLFPRATADHVLYAWNGWIVVFLFFWLGGVISELQRSESISLEKLLHFPISLGGAFLLNYLSSFVSASLILLVPAMIGLSIASVTVMGASMLVTFPLLAGFVLMVTAVTYQFRGWLAALMVNKKRRRTIGAILVGSMIILCQLPNLINFAFLRPLASRTTGEEFVRELHRLDAAVQKGEIDQRQYQERVAAASNARVAKQEAVERSRIEAIHKWMTALDLALPPGWLALGAAKAAQHQVWPGILGTVGLCSIAGLSLRRTYRMTLRFYLGAVRSDRGAAQSADRAGSEKRPPHRVGGATTQRRKSLLERRLPWVPEETAATALATLRSLSRAPEVKMLLLTPLFCVAPFFLAFLFRVPQHDGEKAELPELFRALIGRGMVVMTTLTLSQFSLNQFGFDRGAFRVFVLSPSRRRNILLGKNLSLAPFVFGIGVFVLVLSQFIFRASAAHFLATLIQLLSAYLLMCMMGNYTSIGLPSAVRAGSMKASTSPVLKTLLRLFAGLALMASFLSLFIPLGIEYLWQRVGVWTSVPTDLILSALESLGLLLLYRALLERQGAWLQAREPQILEAVTTKED